MHEHDHGLENESQWIATGWMRRDQPPAALFDALPPVPPAESRFRVNWVDAGHDSTQPPDPTYPNGCAIDVALDAVHACRLTLPCPAARCGIWVISCRACGFAIALATAGRSDDPRSARLPCKLR